MGFVGGASVANLANTETGGASSVVASVTSALGYGLGVAGRGVVDLYATAFSPLSLFSDGSQGVWYDDSLTSSMFQDSAGVTAAALELPVGLQLDLSKSLALGSEIITPVANQDFSSDTGYWSKDTGVTIGGGVCTFTSALNTYALYKNSILTAGVYYEVTFTINSISAGGLKVFVYGASSSTYSTVGTYTVRLLALGTIANSFQIYAVGASTTAVIDNVSLKSIAGNPRYQSTDANRPILSARYNLLTKTEDFSNAVWTAVGTSVATTSPIAAPNGGSAYLATQTTGYINSAAITVSTSVSYAATQYFYAGTATWIQFGIVDSVLTNGGVAWYNIATGATGTSAAIGLGSAPTAYLITPVSGFAGWYVISYTGLPYSTTARTFWRAVATDGSSVSTAATYYPFGADLRPANQATGLIPTYQRVDTSSVYDTVGFPQYIKYTTGNASLSTASINFTATAQMSVFNGLRKLSDAALGMIIELSADLNTNNGTFSLYKLSGSPSNYRYDTKGSVNAAVISSTSYTAPISNVLTALSDISSPSGVLRVNGSQVGQSTATQGTGNYGNYPLYFGGRGGTSLFFNGQEFQTIIVGKTLTATEIANTETYVNSKTKAY